MSLANGAFARIFGDGTDQVLVYINASMFTGLPTMFCVANTKEHGYHTLSAEMAVADSNEADPAVILAKTEQYVANLTDEEAQKLADMMRADFRQQQSAIFAQSMGVVN